MKDMRKDMRRFYLQSTEYRVLLLIHEEGVSDGTKCFHFVILVVNV